MRSRQVRKSSYDLPNTYFCHNGTNSIPTEMTKILMHKRIQKSLYILSLIENGYKLGNQICKKLKCRTYNSVSESCWMRWFHVALEN